MSDNSHTKQAIGGHKMKRHIKITGFTILFAALAFSAAWSAGTQEVRLGDRLLLRVRCASGGYTIDQRVNELQLRANNLLQDGKDVIAFSVRKSGTDSNIYANSTFFMTVSPADAKANGTTSEKLANIWAERLRVIFPKSSPDKPGVGRPGQVGAPGNAH
jgi:hypothetical protein